MRLSKWNSPNPILRRETQNYFTITRKLVGNWGTGRERGKRLQIPWHSRILILNFFVSWCSEHREKRAKKKLPPRRSSVVFSGWENSFSEINKSNKFSIQRSYANKKKIPLRDVLILFERRDIIYETGMCVPIDGEANANFSHSTMNDCSAITSSRSRFVFHLKVIKKSGELASFSGEKWIGNVGRNARRKTTANLKQKLSISCTNYKPSLAKVAEYK